MFVRSTAAEEMLSLLCSALWEGVLICERTPSSQTVVLLWDHGLVGIRPGKVVRALRDWKPLAVRYSVPELRQSLFTGGLLRCVLQTRTLRQTWWLIPAEQFRITTPYGVRSCLIVDAAVPAHNLVSVGVHGLPLAGQEAA